VCEREKERERERGGVPLSFPPELFEKDHLLKEVGRLWWRKQSLDCGRSSSVKRVSLGMRK